MVRLQSHIGLHVAGLAVHFGAVCSKNHEHYYRCETVDFDDFVDRMTRIDWSFVGLAAGTMLEAPDRNNRHCWNLARWMSSHSHCSGSAKVNTRENVVELQHVQTSHDALLESSRSFLADFHS